MLLDYLQQGDTFMLTNQYSAGEFEYLGDFTAEHKVSKERVRFNRHIQIEQLFSGEEILLIC